MSPFERLGIEPTEDAASIKRAYARQLKQVRPDEDPAGFQALHEAYQHCLDHAEQLRWEASEEADVQEHEISVRSDFNLPPEPAEPQPASAPDGDPSQPAHALPEFDFNDFMNELLQRGRSQSSTQLMMWLRGLEPLYSLDLKLALRSPVSQVLAKIETPLPVKATEIVLAFFSLDVIGQQDAWLHEHAAYAQHRAESNQRFQHTLEMLQSHRVKPVDRMLVRELAQPPHWPRRLFIAAVPLLPSRLVSTLRALHDIDRQQAQLQLDGKSTAFWQAATDPHRLAAPRLAIAAARCVAYYFALFGLLRLLAAAYPLSPARDLITIFAIWLGWAGAQAAAVRWTPAAWKARIDRFTIFCAIALAAAAWLAPAHPIVAGVLAFVVSSQLSRGDSSLESIAQYASFAMLAGLGLCLFIATGSWRLTIPYTLIGVGVLHIAHAVAYAWIRGISVPEARERRGWYAYMIGLSVVAIGLGLYKLANS